MEGTCSMYGERNTSFISVGKPQRKNNLEDPGVDGE
jgi:hypothetical protein